MLKKENISAVRCSICNKLVLEHSHSEDEACFEKAQAAEHEAELERLLNKQSTF
jgi:hypothetical protein